MVLGVDFGIVNRAIDSDGHGSTGRPVNGRRRRHARRRTKLQRKGTRAPLRRPRQRKANERRFATWGNHTCSTRLVTDAQDTQRALALADLTGIRTPMTVGKAQRCTFHSWAFSQLRQFGTYKAQQVGVPGMRVDPRNTSRLCPACGHVAQANRPPQSRCSGGRCGFAGLADHSAAVNIGRRAAVN
jgi:IS605 OrfB family transposase